MQAFIITTLIGVFALDDKNKVISFRPFSKDPSIAAEIFKKAEFEIVEEEKKVMSALWKKGYKEFVFPFRKSGVKNIQENSPAEKFIKENLRKIAIGKNLFKDQAELNNFLVKTNIELSKVKIKRAISRDNLVIQSIGAIEELDKATNILIERLREWYGLHFPEMDRIISSHERYAKIVEKFGLRNNISEKELDDLRNKSMGAELKDFDVEPIQNFAKQINDLYRLREQISEYVEKILNEVAPNLRALAGPQLAAKLIAKAGGLEKLAKSPSSLIQLIGAEKALFRYLHGHGKSPKFGILFSHPLIQNAPAEHKGKIARILAAKLSMAIKIDYYSKEYKADNLKKDLEERVKEILSSKK